MRIDVVATRGPLFVVSESPAVLSFLASTFPQFAKRDLGWCLAVEELHCLHTYIKEREAAAAGSGERCAVLFRSETAAAQFERLQDAYRSSCDVYTELTLHHGYRLRHGTVFGANFIGYDNLKAHGECLVFIGPLSPLEKVRAARVARSVGKTALVAVRGSAEETAVTLTQLAGGPARHCESPPHRQARRQRRESDTAME